MPGTVLIVDDERAIVEILDFNLRKAGYDTLKAYDGTEGLRLAREGNPDAILLDVMLPKLDGFSVCRALREEGDNVPIIMLTAREEERDKVFGLETGADDYITKPFSMRELLARVKTNLRRSFQNAGGESGHRSAQITVRELCLDLERHVATRAGQELDLSEREFALLKCLAQSPGKVLSRKELLRQVWQYDYYGDDLRAVDVAVRRLREKLERNPAAPEYVMTRRGAGYYLMK